MLTEWKKAISESDARTKFRQARDQAANYARGPLAGNELRDYRYAIVVTEKQVEPPANERRDGVTYRHINMRSTRTLHPAPPDSVMRKPVRRPRVSSAAPFR